MRYCKSCAGVVPSRVLIEGKWRNLANRKYCFTCSPFGQHNTCKVALNEDGNPERELLPSTHEKEQWRIRVKRRRQEFKRRMVALLGGKCEICGYDRSVWALTFHHKDPKIKRFSLSMAYHYKWKVVEEELAGCRLLCNNCHAELHGEEFQVPVAQSGQSTRPTPVVSVVQIHPGIPFWVVSLRGKASVF